jgi:fructokinase
MGEQRMRGFAVTCVGELLWDILPTGERLLGGAPANVAYHLKRLGVDVRLISRVGVDELGKAARLKLRKIGISDEAIQTDSSLPTGAAAVRCGPGGLVEYDFVTPAAWDRIQRADSGDVDAVVFGTLAQRDACARESVRYIVKNASVRVYDINLRPPHTELSTVTESLRLATVVKMNEQEAETLARELALPPEPQRFAQAMEQRYGPRVLCVTRGERGAWLVADGEWNEVQGARVEVVDTVGAGDAFLAALVVGLLAKGAWADVLRKADQLGALVASRKGAMPAIDVRRLSHLNKRRRT